MFYVVKPMCWIIWFTARPWSRAVHPMQSMGPASLLLHLQKILPRRKELHDYTHIWPCCISLGRDFKACFYNSYNKSPSDNTCCYMRKGFNFKKEAVINQGMHARTLKVPLQSFQHFLLGRNWTKFLLPVCGFNSPEILPWESQRNSIHSPAAPLCKKGLK